MILFVRGVRPRQYLREGAEPGEAEMSATDAHSVVAPTPLAKRVAAAIVIAYALITIIPLLWIVATSFKTAGRLDRLSAEAFVQPFARRLREPLHHPHAADARIYGEPAPATAWYDKLVRSRNMVIAGRRT